jgi:hypothetical protein
MTGPEHYREAEHRLLMAWEEDRVPEDVAHLVAEAQVHAILALAAATALPSGAPATASRQAWVRAIHGLGDDYDVTESFA